nr:HWE histidine kinase domain-containing protein [Methylocapsa sp. S129]
MAAMAQSALDAMPCAVCLCGSDGVILRYNRRAIQLWDRRPRLDAPEDRFCGSSRLYHLDGRHLPHAETPMAHVLRTGLPVGDIDVVIERPDGSRVVALCDIEPLLDARGSVEGAINCFRDITARKGREQKPGANDESRVVPLMHAFEATSQLAIMRDIAPRKDDEGALRESERRFKDFLDALPTAIYTTDASGRITFFNEAAVEFWGHRPEVGISEWCGSWRLFNPDGTPLPHDQCPMALALKEDRSIRNVEAIAERPDGTRVPFMPYPTPLHDASGALVGGVNMLIDISFHKDAAARQRLLINELNHRVKNTLATVQSVVSQTLHGTSDLRQARDDVENRLLNLARAHDILTAENWEGADLLGIAEAALAGHDADGLRHEIDGPTVRLTPKTALALSLALQELCANAVSYGALSGQSGKVSLSWSVDDTSEARRLKLLWCETGGPMVIASERRGLGFRLIERGLTRELGGEAKITFSASGVVCSIDVGLSSSAR